MEAVGGDKISVLDGKLIDMSSDEYGALKYARAAIGIKADGSIVTYVTRGKNLPISHGETYNEVSKQADQGRMHHRAPA
ncbi:MAG: phosphodiester glycosidase family protein [Anaerovoracaceae bacterium]